MEKETITPLERNIIATEVKTSSECCSTTTVNNTDVCCKSDEVKKTESEENCGCSTTERKNSLLLIKSL